MRRAVVMTEKGAHSRVIQISPIDLKEMEHDKEVLVSRIRINTRIIEIESTSPIDYDGIYILKRAVKNSHKNAVYKYGTSRNIVMRVADVLRAFNDVDQMPSNSFSMSR